MAEYIERSAALKSICSYCSQNGKFCGIACADYEQIKTITAADVRPVVRGRWVYTDKSKLVCSNCGTPVAFALKEDGWHHGYYCPLCGAVMED